MRESYMQKSMEKVHGKIRMEKSICKKPIEKSMRADPKFHVRTNLPMLECRQQGNSSRGEPKKKDQRIRGGLL